MFLFIMLNGYEWIQYLMISFYYNGLKFLKIYKHLACLQPTYSYFASSSNILINSLILVPSVEIELCSSNPVGIYMLKFNNRNTRARCAICSKLTIKIPGTCFTPCSSVSVVNFELVNADWEKNKSLINMLNKNWPSTDLWRTPESSTFSFCLPHSLIFSLPQETFENLNCYKVLC